MSKRVERGDKAHFNKMCLLIVSQSTELLEASCPPVFVELMSWSRVSWGQYTAQQPSRQEQAGQVPTGGLLCATATQTCNVIIRAHSIRQDTNTWHHPDANVQMLGEDSHMDPWSHIWPQPPSRCTGLKTHSHWSNLSFPVPLWSRPEEYFCNTKTAEPQRNTVMLYWGQEAWAPQKNLAIVSSRAAGKL